MYRHEEKVCRYNYHHLGCAYLEMVRGESEYFNSTFEKLNVVIRPLLKGYSTDSSHALHQFTHLELTIMVMVSLPFCWLAVLGPDVFLIKDQTAPQSPFAAASSPSPA